MRGKKARLLRKSAQAISGKPDVRMHEQKINYVENEKLRAGPMFTMDGNLIMKTRPWNITPADHARKIYKTMKASLQK